MQILIYVDQNIIICSSSKKRVASDLIDGSQRSRDLILSFFWALPHFYRVLHLLHLYFCWQAQLILNILPSLTRRFIVLRGEGGFMIHTETSGRSTYRNLLGTVIPSLPICQGMFALCDCWLGQPTVNSAFTKCKQKLISTLGFLDVFTVFSYF